jgi:hypothetical protein
MRYWFTPSDRGSSGRSNYGRTRNNIRIEDARLQQSWTIRTPLRAAQEVEDGLTGYLKAQEAETFARTQRGTPNARSIGDAAAPRGRRRLSACWMRSASLREENTRQTRSSIATTHPLYKALGGGGRYEMAVICDRMREERTTNQLGRPVFRHTAPVKTGINVKR